MKKIFLFALLVSSVFFAHAQSKIDSATKKADTIINVKTKKLDSTKSKITDIQSSMSNVEKQKLIEESNQSSLKKSISILENKKNKTKKEIIELGIQKRQFIETSKKYQKAVDSLNTLKTNLIKQIDSAKKQIIEAEIKIKSKNKQLDEADERIMIKDKEINTKTKNSEKLDAHISNQLDLLKTVAIIEALDLTTIHLSNNKIITYKINSVHINVAQGIILEIMVETDKGTFRNKGRAKSGGIVIADLLHFEDFTEKKLYLEKYSSSNPLENNEEDAFVYLKDVIRYKPVSSYTDAVYGEFEITLPSADGNRLYLIKEYTSINSYFNIAAFTDIKGISGEPNGIAQFTADAKFMLNTKAISGTSIVGFNNISFQGGLSKFDTEFKGTELSTSDIVNRKDLLQRANYKLGVKLNIIKGYLPSVPDILYNNFEVNIGYNVVGSQIFKTGIKDPTKTTVDTTFKTVTQNQWYIEPAITFSRSKNFSMCVALPFYRNDIKKSSMIANNSSEWWFVPGISLMYFGKRDVGSKIFFRYNHYINLKDKTQAFSQMQLGYSLNLTQVLKE